MLIFKPSTKRRKTPFAQNSRAVVTLSLLLALLLHANFGIAQTFPPESSCTSKDLELIGARVGTTCGGTGNILELGINNKTGSTRTAFALWGTLRKTKGASVIDAPIYACATSPVPGGSNTYLPSTYYLVVEAGTKYELIDLFLAWTTSNKREDCNFLAANTADISPKCGTATKITINIGLTAAITERAYCATGGQKYSAVTVTPSGSVEPYVVSLKPFGGSIIASYTLNEGIAKEFTDLNPGTKYVVTVTDKNGTGCSITSEITPVAPADVTFGTFAGDFTKDCRDNLDGKNIGETAVGGFQYVWTSATSTSGLTSTSIAYPKANPSVSTVYTVTKTASNGCSATRDVTVTVNKPTVVAEAGDGFTKTCTLLTTGQAVGEGPTNGYSYAWTKADGSAATGLTPTNTANPTANPSVTTTYRVTKTHTTSGCSDFDDVVVTVNNTVPTFSVNVTQPTLCANSGSVTFTAPIGNDFRYSIDNGTTWGTSATFSSLASGSVTGYKVKNNVTGCESASQNCAPAQAPPAPEEKANTSFSAKIELQEDITVKAFPNPFNSNINFSVKSPVAGYGSIELFNMQGQKVASVFQGRIPQGISNFQYNLQTNSAVSNLIWVMRVGNKTVNGKLLSIKK